jgi:ferredoxin
MDLTLKEKEKISNVFIPPHLEFFFPKDFEGKKIQLVGEFPRRVEQYEKIAECMGFSLRAPLAGIISILNKDKTNTFSLKVSGKNQIINYFRNSNEKKNPDNLSKESWIDFLNDNGLYSFEYKKPLAEIFKEKIEKIVFLLRDSYAPNFWQNLFQHYEKELYLLKSFFQQNFPNIEIHFYPDISKKNTFYGLNNYQYHYRYVAYKNKNHVKVFSPTTLFALLRSIYFEEPFTKSIMIFRNYNMESTSIGFYYHGTNLREIDLKIPYLVNFTYKDVISLDKEYYFNIYEDYYFYFKNIQKTNFCTGCMICNNFCPTNANPMSLYETKLYFKKDQCILCGVCEEVCESNLLIMDKIRYEASN